MLINFTFSNYKSYRDVTEFSMVPLESIKDDRESLVNISGMEGESVLPLAALYGGNAAGKTSFAQALALLKYMVRTGRVEHVTPFRLDEESRTKSTDFKITLATEKEVWVYALSVLNNKVIEESLFCVNLSQQVFSRSSDGSVLFNEQFFAGKTKDELKIACDMAGSVPQDNVLLSTLRRHQGVMLDMARVCEKIYMWFDEVLQIKESNTLGLIPSVVSSREAFSQLLREAGVGMQELSIRQIPIQEMVGMAEPLSWMERSMNDGEFRSHGDTIVTKENGEIKVYKCGAVHVLPSGRSETFEMREESDGTLCFINLLPVLTNPNSKSRVYVIDELDRSLHTKLSRRLIERHLSMVRSGVPQQLIYTTHDVLLMDDELLRKDEIWLVDRYQDGKSELTAFIEFQEAASETDIRGSYMQGRMGGVPDFNL